MNIVLVSQRVTVFENCNEQRDAMDVNWAKFVQATGGVCVPVPNDRDIARELLQTLDWRGLILTGGNDLSAYGGDAPERDATEKVLLEAAIQMNKPTIGVCRGMQLIQDYFGVGLKKVSGHVAQDHPVVTGGETHMENSFHNFAAFDSVEELDICSVAEQDGVVEAVKHKTLPVYGIMWHPERNSPFREKDISWFSSLLFESA